MAWGISYRAEAAEPSLNGTRLEDANAVLEDRRRLSKEFPDLIRSMIEATDPKDVAQFPAMDRLPFRHDLTAGPILFIGDSNHAVSSLLDMALALR